jgi:hypothetical protein
MLNKRDHKKLVDKAEKFCRSTLIKKKIKFSSYKEIQSGAVAKSYMGKGFLVYEENLIFFFISVGLLLLLLLLCRISRTIV